jgi:hypothetical protein
MSPSFRPGALRAYLRRLSGSAITAMVAAYVLAVSLFMIWRDISVSPEYVVGLFLLGALALGRTRMFLADWVPFLLLFLGYEFLRGFAHQTGIPVHYSDVIALERLVAGGHVPTRGTTTWPPSPTSCTLFIPCCWGTSSGSIAVPSSSAFARRCC